MNKLKRVEVAIRRMGGRGCSWLSDKRAHFKTTKAKGCAGKPRLLRAAGTTRWRYKLTKRLPRGSYQLYVRPMNRAGVTPTRFTRKDRTLVRFRVR